MLSWYGPKNTFDGWFCSPRWQISRGLLSSRAGDTIDKVARRPGLAGQELQSPQSDEAVEPMPKVHNNEIELFKGRIKLF
jgi:hypothetical protein